MLFADKQQVVDGLAGEGALSLLWRAWSMFSIIGISMSGPMAAPRWNKSHCRLLNVQKYIIFMPLFVLVTIGQRLISDYLFRPDCGEIAWSECFLLRLKSADFAAWKDCPV